MPGTAPSAEPSSRSRPALRALISQPDDLARLSASHHHAVGLVKTEQIPHEQLREFLDQLLTQSPDAWICLPSLDDEPQIQDPNPALGLRGVRRYQAFPEELHDLLIALSTTTARDEPLHLLIPMLTNRTQVAPVVAQIQECLGTRSTKIGAMIQTPAAALQAEEFASLCDFMSIGSTDLAQYVYAADRQTPALNAYAHPSAPPLMELYARVIHAAREASIEVGVCGLAASDPTVGPFLLATGASHLSLPVDELDKRTPGTPSAE